MVKNLKLNKRIVSIVLLASIGASSITSALHLYKHNEINRVKGYLDDFLVNDSYVDLSNISTSYDIRSFDGKYLRYALEDMDVDYVRITDSIVDLYSSTDGYQHKLAFNYDKQMGVDLNGDPVYECYDPIRNSNGDEVSYIIPEGFVLQDVKSSKPAVDYSMLDDLNIDVSKNKNEESYTISLNKK